MLQDYWNILVKDREFFDNYKNKFREEFINLLQREKPGILTKKGLYPLVDKLYILLFSFQKDPLGELFNLTYRLAHYEIDLKKAITKPLLKMIKEYIDFIIDKDGDYERIKAFISLTDIYLEKVEEAFSKYVGELRIEVERKEKKVIKGERQAIANLLKKLISRGEDEISVIIFYKAMPIVCKSKILHMEDLFIRLKTHHIKAFSLGDEVFLKHKKLPHAISSRITNINVFDFNIEVEIIGFIDPPQDKRQHVRVAPDEPIPVVIKKDNVEITGTMADISVGGVGIYLKENNILKPCNDVLLKFNLKKGVIKVEGHIVYETKHEDLKRVGIKYKLDLHQEEIVNDYIMERQFEILRELKD